MASTNDIERIKLDFPDLDIHKTEYKYAEEVKNKASWQLGKAMMRVPNLLMLEWLKSSDQLLTVEEILNAEVHEDLTFKELDMVGVCWPL